MKGVLFRRTNLVVMPGIKPVIKTYNIYFPGDTFAGSLIDVMSGDVILEVDGYEPPDPPRGKRYWDGSVAWWD